MSDRAGCDSSACVVVDTSGGLVVVSDSKDPDAKPITFLPHQWKRLLEQIKAGDDVDFGVLFFPLAFTEAEIEAFCEGVNGGEFDLETS